MLVHSRDSIDALLDGALEMGDLEGAIFRHQGEDLVDPTPQEPSITFELQGAAFGGLRACVLRAKKPITSADPS